MPGPIISALDDVVKQNWSRGIQERNDEQPRCYEMKLKGTPWWCGGQFESYSGFKIMLKNHCDGYIFEQA